MDVRQYVFVKVQLVIWFQSSLSHETLATCTLLRPADCIKERITHKERSTSHFTHKEVGWFSDMSASRLQCHMPRDSPMLLGWESYAGVIHECSTVRACKGAACDLVSKQPFP